MWLFDFKLDFRNGYVAHPIQTHTLAHICVCKNLIKNAESDGM